MSTRSRIAYCFDTNSSIVSSYCHYDGYIEGMGFALYNCYTDKKNAFYLASAGDFRSILHSKMNDEGYYDIRTVKELEHFTKFPFPAIDENFDTLIEDFKDSDQDYLYVFFEKENCWKVFANVWDKKNHCPNVEFLGNLDDCVKKAVEKMENN